MIPVAAPMNLPINLFQCGRDSQCWWRCADTSIYLPVVIDMLRETFYVLFGDVHSPETSRDPVVHPGRSHHLEADPRTHIPDLIIPDRFNQKLP